MPKQSFLRSKANLVLRRPLVVGALLGHGAFKPQIQQAVKIPFDLLELRLDTFPFVHQPLSEAALSAARLIRDLKKKTRKALLLTIRADAEKGIPVTASKRITNDKRLPLFKALTPMADMVDVELREPQMAKDVARWAHRHHVDVIHSYHNFRETPSHSLLNKLLIQSQRNQGDVFKAAVMPRNNEELASFLAWGNQIRSPKPVLIGMGTVGLPSRFIGYSFGSVMTYGHLGRRAAPGQVGVGELYNCIQEIYCSVIPAKAGIQAVRTPSGPRLSPG